MTPGSIDVRFANGDSRTISDALRVMEEAFDPKFGEAWSGSQLIGFLALPGTLLGLAHDGDEPVGFCVSQTIGHEAELMLLGVLPSHRRKGVAKRLLQGLINQLIKAGVKRLFLEMRTDNQEAFALYTEFGFKKIGLRKAYYRNASGHCRDAVTMARKITAP